MSSCRKETNLRFEKTKAQNKHFSNTKEFFDLEVCLFQFCLKHRLIIR